MGKFYLHRGTKLVAVGECPDGHEEFQGNGEYEVGLGDPPAHIVPDDPVPPAPYGVRRSREFPPLGDQLDVLWKILGPTLPPNSEARAMYDKILEVKNKYPKPPNSR